MSGNRRNYAAQWSGHGLITLLDFEPFPNGLVAAPQPPSITTGDHLQQDLTLPI